jgi:alpha-N-arabinofuranosidase
MQSCCPIKIISDDYVFGTEKLPAVSCSASKDSTGKTHVSLVNIDIKNTQTITVNLEGGQYTSVTGRILTSNKLQNFNSFG